MKALVVLLLFVFAFGRECMVCNTACGDWSCVRDCSSATFDAPRCLADRNGNGWIDGCGELPLCLTVHGRLVCPDSDKLCTSTEWIGPREFGGAIHYFSEPQWSYSTYTQKLSEFSLTCPEVPTSSDDRHRFLTSESPVWVCGGALYPDVWLSFDSCSYTAYDGATWRVKDGNCSNPNKVWQKVQGGRVVEERSNNVSLRGVGIDARRRDCGRCDTTLAGLLSGGTEEAVEPPQDAQQPSEDVQCLNPRFFSGQARKCRAGGVTILGASCCGISGMTRGLCNREEKELKKRREAGLCREIGEYCSRRVRLGPIRVCRETSRSYCCFNSQFARLIHECGRGQIGKGWGEAKNPDCSGFSIEEFTRVDLSDPACVAAIESWVQSMASRIGDRVGEEIAQRATNSIQSWLNDAKNQKGYGGEK